jgi:EAL domain-containing protein (putative c-di-GMP-specific phosphodiesterase class I)
MRALIVDDDDLVRRTLARILGKFEVEVTQADDGFGALKAIDDSAKPFDVIFCDLQMPGRDGVQTLHDLADRNVSAGIVLISGHSTDIVAAAENMARHHALNVVGRLPKPFGRKDIQTLLDKARQPHAPRAAVKRAAVTADDLREGIAQNQIKIAVQPKVNPVSRTLVGVEVLARWDRGADGMVSPVEFIPLAEENGLIDALTDAVMAQAVSAYRHFDAAGCVLTVAVNLSTQSMTRLDLADRLHAAVTASGIPPQKFMFEVTESQLAGNMAAFLETATRLRLMGFKLSIDDFGTGFSTMEQVSRLPISELKIDRAFVAGATINPRTRHILTASLQLGRGLKLHCVCEGVENQGEWELVRDLGAESVQGYFVSKPMEVADLPGWLEAWNAKHR